MHLNGKYVFKAAVVDRKGSFLIETLPYSYDAMAAV